MTQRFTDTELKAIIATEITDFTVFKQIAESIVDEQLLSKGLSSNRLKLIQLNLAAHFTCMIDKQEISEAHGSAKSTFADVYAEGLRATQYGQTAIVLDTSKSLISIEVATANATNKKPFLKLL
jgi:hypothetical protein